jgi:WD40 repeat protein
VLAVAFSDDGHRVVSGSRDTTLRLWNADTAGPIGDPMTGHTAAVFNVQFGPDGARVLSRSADHTERLWDARAVRPLGAPMNSHAMHNSPIDVVFSPDGQSIVSTSADSSRRLWPPPASSAWPSLVCAKLSQNMSHQQWRDWVSPDIGYTELCSGLPVAPDNHSR